MTSTVMTVKLCNSQIWLSRLSQMYTNNTHRHTGTRSLWQTQLADFLHSIPSYWTTDSNVTRPNASPEAFTEAKWQYFLMRYEKKSWLSSEKAFFFHHSFTGMPISFPAVSTSLPRKGDNTLEYSSCIMPREVEVAR